MYPYSGMTSDQVRELLHSEQNLWGLSKALGATTALQLWVLGMLLPRIFHEQSPSDSNAFWLTRPIGPWNVLAAKALLLGPVLLLLPMLLRGTECAIAGREDMWNWGARFMYVGGVAFLLAGAICSLTYNLSQYLGFAAAAALASIGWMCLARIYLPPALFISWHHSLQLGKLSIELTPGGLLIPAGLLAVILHQYSTRKTRRSVALLVILTLLYPFL